MVPRRPKAKVQKVPERGVLGHKIGSQLNALEGYICPRAEINER